MANVFRPAETVMGRLRYAYKIVLVPVLLLVPLGLVAKAYVDIQRSQVAFSAKERVGVAYLTPLLDLTARTVTARHLAVSGSDPAQAGLPAALAAVQEAERNHGAELGTAERFAAAGASLRTAQAATGARAAFDAYTEATAALLALVVQVSDGSNLTLDPDLDSYYVMDALVFRLPVLLDTAGQAADRALLARGATGAERENARIDLAVAGGTLSSMLASVETGMATAFAKTASPDLRADVEPGLAATQAAVRALQTQVDAAVKTGRPDTLRAEQGQAASTAAAELTGRLAPALDALLATRIGGFESKSTRVQGLTLVAVLLVAYLLVGFYRSATRPLREMQDVLAGLAAGDLTRTVPVRTSDELGRMGTALNEATGRVREAVLAIAAGTDGVGRSADELTGTAAGLRASADGTSAGAGSADRAAAQVAGTVDVLAAGAEQMSASIREIAQSATEAATIAAEAADAAAATNTTVQKLGHSSAEVGSVLKAITAIAEQTNLLALNATIEAARAGEAGRGFAIVAGEVKELAGQTARATDDIATRIETIQADTRAAVEAIADIGRVIGRINDLQGSIASAVEEQSATTNEISRGVTEVSGGSQEIAGCVGAVARSATETADGATATQLAADGLAGTAAQLREVVARFRVG